MGANSSDAGSVSFIGSGATGATVAGGSAIGVINEYAVLIGLIISLVSLVVGVVFKIMSLRKEAEMAAAELEYREAEAAESRQQFHALAALLDAALAEKHRAEAERKCSEESKHKPYRRVVAATKNSDEPIIPE